MGLVDFNDLEQLSYTLLQDPVIRADYPLEHLDDRRIPRYKSSAEEDRGCLGGRGRQTVCGGDPKQSFTDFGADVGVFVQAKRRSPPSVWESPWENFRSRPELIDFANSSLAV